MITTWPSQRGVGLIEVMVGLTAGLLLLAALSYFFLGSRQLGRTHGDVSRMQESGRTALEILGRSVRQAGSRSSPLVGFVGNALTATEGASNAPDAITVAYEVQDGGESDCLGNTVASGTVTYVFAVDTGTHSLTCTNGTGAAAIVVMDNIDDMQIRYGVDTDGDGAIDAYRTGDLVTTPAQLAQVAAVRVSLLVRGPTEAIAAMNTQTYKYNGNDVTKTDGVLRQVYTSTFTIRNQAH
jgi:type IV pilus assembly protein PilW